MLAQPDSRFIIYGLFDPRDGGELRYIGRSTSGLRRPNSHCTPGSLRKDGFSHKGNWIRQLLALDLKPEVVVLEVFPNSDPLSEMERQAIELYRSMGFRLVNATDGGEDGSPGPLSPETRAKISRAAKGRVISEEQRRKIAIGRTGKIHSPETRAKMSAALKGRKHSVEHRKKNAEARLRFYAQQAH